MCYSLCLRTHESRKKVRTVPSKKAAAAAIFGTGVLLEIPYLIPAVAGPTIQRLFGLSNTQLGICVGAGSFGAMAGALAAGHIVHRLGAFPIMVTGFLGVMAATLAGAFASGFASLVLCLACMGVAAVLIGNANSSQLADLFPDMLRRTMSFFSALWFGSWAVCAPLMGLWMDVAHGRGWDAWGFRAVFVVGFLLTGLCLALAVILIRPVAAPPAARLARATRRTDSPPVAALKGSGQWMWVPLLTFFHGLMIGPLLGLVNLTVQDKFGVDDFHGASVLGGMTLGLTLGRLVMATVRHPWDELRLLRFSSLLGGGFFALGLVVTNYWVSLAAFFVGGFLACATYPCIWTIIGNRFPVAKAKLYGYATASLALACLIGPYLVGFLADHGVPLSLAMGICPLAGGALALSSLLWTLQDGRRALARAERAEAGA